jgi:glutamate dehydrogenase
MPATCNPDRQARWFYSNLGIDDAYFAQEPLETIVHHILSLYGAKVAAFARNDTNFEIRLDREESDHAVYIDTSEPGVSNISGPQYEQRYTFGFGLC